ncbi:MAG TPA: ABC transporter substrate-binding protein [Tepidisphaeraceae bacterium]|nr:ABC transporter substrate-binding protein [Tepidisphaeraceae bacterium]
MIRPHCLLVPFALIVAAGAFVLISGCENDQSSSSGGGGNEIVIGHYGSMTGPTATFGQSTDKGIRLALDEINGAGGVLGKPIRVITEDDQSKPTEAVNAVEKLISRDNVIAVIGEVASSNSLAAAPVAQAAGIPMLTPASTNPKVTEVGDYIFRSCFIDPFQGGVMAKFALNDLKAKRLAILYDVNSDYSMGLRQFFTEEIKRSGGQIVADEAYTQQDQDFRGQLTKIKNANPDAIYVPGYYTQVGAIARQAKELGINVPLLGGDGWDSEKTVEIGGDAINGNYFTNHYSPEEDRPEVKTFVEGYRKKYNQTPDAMAILGYDAMRLMADAIRRAGSTDGAKIRDALAATKNFPGASGTITIDENRNAQKPIVILKFENGQQKFVTSIKP